MAIDPREFRNTVGCFATGITIITTTDDDGNPVGFTANSFSSVSLDPPLVLFCLDRRVASFESFREGGKFAVNILGNDQQDLSNQFAKSGSDKWDGIEYETVNGGCPLFEGCIASFDCDVYAVHEGGDHVIVVGEVTRMSRDEGGPDPLLYFRGGYASINDAT